MDKRYVASFFQPPLFWDVDPKCLGIDEHARFIIERAVTRGDIGDWRMLLNLYGKKRVRDAALTIRSLDPKTLNYLSVYFNIEETAFRCCS
ncbi:MAG: hypothetical protein KKB30_13155 [Proteobacteria bacterium]|nr:hypothetical protein [Pseudomonadota bacterium]MBU1716823.1 hypothetical protein [Pseudomonadota bacterium]